MNGGDMYSKTNKLGKTIGGIVLAASALAATAAPVGATGGSSSDPATSPTITDIVAASGGEFDADRNDYDILLNAVLVAGLDGALADPSAELTVLAPNDRAFLRLARELGYQGRSEADAWTFLVGALTELGEGDPVGPLTTVLTYHVLPGSLDYRDVRTGGPRITLGGGEINPQEDRTILDADPDNIDARLLFPRSNIEAANGMIHTVNRVILPLDLDQPGGTIAERVSESGGDFDRNGSDYDILLTAVSAAGLVDALSDPNASLTVLAPTDRAFVRTARDLGYHGWDEAGAWDFLVETLTELGDGDPIPVLTEILTYHVIPGEIDYRSLRLGGEQTTLNGASITVLEDRTILDTFDGATADGIEDAKVLYARSNIAADNGTIHTVNRVLLPFGSS